MADWEYVSLSLVLIPVCVQAGISCESYRFKSTLQQDMATADLVISHAGAGSIMEALGARNFTI